VRQSQIHGPVVHHAGALILRPPPGNEMLAEILTRIRALPTPS
jgi:hypothetical protein